MHTMVQIAAERDMLGGTNGLLALDWFGRVQEQGPQNYFEHVLAEAPSVRRAWRCQLLLVPAEAQCKRIIGSFLHLCVGGIGEALQLVCCICCCCVVLLC